MDPVALVCILLGVLIILSRGPLIVAPQATIRAYRRMLDSERSVRITGAALAVFGAAMVGAGLGRPDLAARVILVLGFFLGVLALGMLVFAAAFRSLYTGIFDFSEESVDPMVLRIAGVIAVSIGAWLVRFGLGG